MKNFIQPGKTIPITLGSTKSSGDGHELADQGLVGVLQASGESGDVVEMLIEGVVELTRDAADTFSQGDAVYWNEAAGEVTTDNLETPMGFAWEAKAAAAGNIQVKLLGHVG
jgi:predicted RecA/RadA family phage recombinase